MLFRSLGSLGAGESYERSVNITVPDGYSGTLYVQVRSSGPFEFVYTDNNSRIAGPVPITLAPAPDLQVVDIVAPTAADEGATIEVQWTVRNEGEASANGGWLSQRESPLAK